MDYELKHYMTLFEFREEDLIEPPEVVTMYEEEKVKDFSLQDLKDQLMDRVSLTDNDDYDDGYNAALNYVIGVIDNKLRGQE